jgi:hypothetical protein
MALWRTSCEFDIDILVGQGIFSRSLKQSLVTHFDPFWLSTACTEMSSFNETAGAEIDDFTFLSLSFFFITCIGVLFFVQTRRMLALHLKVEYLFFNYYIRGRNFDI